MPATIHLPQCVDCQYVVGLDTTQLAQKYRVSDEKVRCHLAQRQIRRRTIGERNAVFVDERELRRLVDEQLSQSQIARRMRVSQATVERRLRALGLRSKRGRGSPLEQNYFWNGGRRTDKHRYVLVKCPGHPFATKSGYVREHRLVMERVLGRYLQPEEVVHHIDANPQNNHPDNLQVFSSNTEHFRHEWQENPNFSTRDRQRKRYIDQAQDRS
jgi:predicted DNA-binding protein (UPF0251 family)